MIRTITEALAHKRSNLAEKEKGFTLIELLVVVIIIGILAAIAIPVYLGIQGNAKDSAVKSDVSNLKTAAVAWATDHNGALPTDLTALSPYGYTVPGQENYATSGLPTMQSTGTAFCIIATSVTNKKFGASDIAGVKAAAACSTAGVLS